MSLELAKSLFDIDGKDPKLTPLKGNAGTPAFHYPFAKLNIRDITVQNPDIVLVSDAVSNMANDAPKLILGMGILRQLHLYIAYKEQKLYVTAASAH